MPGASARYSCLRTPVETSTSPCVRMDPIGQVSARGAKTTTGESILPSKIEPASLGFDFEKRTTLQVFLSKTKGKLSFLLRTTLMFFLPKSNPLRWAFPSKIEPASLGFDFEKRTTLQVFLSKTKGKLSFLLRTTMEEILSNQVLETKN